MADRGTKERKLMALMINDLGIADIAEPEMKQMNEEVRAMSQEDLDGTLASRLELPDPADEEAMDFALAGVQEPERLSADGPEGFTGVPDMSHEARPEEREG